MSRRLRIGLAAWVAVVIVTAGSALAFNGDGGNDPGENGQGDNAERVVERLEDAGITTDTDELDALADANGLGGAVRILAWAEAAGIDPSEIVAMRDEGMGWGQIRRVLEDEHPDATFHPGLGWIMGGHGQGHGNGQGQGQGQGQGD
jgi:hypothetical protein